MVEILCRGISGKSYSISVEHKDIENDLCEWFKKLHQLDMPTATIENYALCVNVCDSHCNKILLGTKIVNLIKKYGKEIHLCIVLKSFTMSDKFNFSTMTGR